MLRNSPFVNCSIRHILLGKISDHLTHNQAFKRQMAGNNGKLFKKLQCVLKNFVMSTKECIQELTSSENRVKQKQ